MVVSTVVVSTVVIAAVLDVVLVITALGVRTALQRRRTGDAGWRLGRPDSAAEAVARALLVSAVGCLAVALVRAGDPPAPALAIVATVGAVGAIVLVCVAQLQMGSSWRVGVDPGERTGLVRSGIYASVRNPIYTGMAAFAIAHAALTPSSWSLVGALAMVAGVQIQARRVEEPYLACVHGDAWRSWAVTSGRFIPRLGRAVSGRRAGQAETAAPQDRVIRRPTPR